MAIYHLTAKVISRGKGQSAIAAAAYRSGERLRDELAGEDKHYHARKERILFTDIMAPKGAPEWVHDRNSLWNRAEQAEKRKDAQLAREVEVALPHELTDQQREWLVKDFAREAFVRRGYVVDIALHAPDRDADGRNYHAHLLVSMRTVEEDGFAAKKDRSLNERGQLESWRAQWGNLVNRHLERHGHEARVDHRSLAEQGVTDREPTIHLGYAAQGMERRGEASDRMEIIREIIASNDIRLDAARRRLKPEPVDDADRPEPQTDRAKAIARAVAEPDHNHVHGHVHGEVRANLAVDSAFKGIGSDAGAPPPREERRDKRGEAMEREDERGLSLPPSSLPLSSGAAWSAARHGSDMGSAMGARLAAGLERGMDGVANGLGGVIGRAADAVSDLFMGGSTEQEKRKPMQDEKEAQSRPSGQTSAQAWALAAEQSKAANAEREQRALADMERKLHRGLQGQDIEKALKERDRER